MSATQQMGVFQQPAMIIKRFIVAKGIVIAGERSGVGKTTLTLALVKAFMDRGLRVQCFKVGPDFIDPGYHAAISGRPPRNLDGWMMSRDYCTASFVRNTEDVDIAVIEGVMGVFDGYDGTSENGSTAQIAKWLHLPVILVVDGSAFARTAGALVLGYETYDPQLAIAGVIFNRVSGDSHFRYLSEGVAARCTAGVLGYVPRNREWEIPERHLGLVLAEETTALLEKISSLSCLMETTVAVDKIIAMAGEVKAGQGETPSYGVPAADHATTIGVARDEAFCFYYQDNLDYLEDCGARITYFSPVHDAALPSGISGLYLGGGYPELHAQALSKNKAMRDAVVAFCKSGKPVYAECGGFLYLLNALVDQDGIRHAMSGLFPAEARMRGQLQRLGYVEIEAQKECPFLAQGEKVRGHEFHYSDISEMPQSITRCYRAVPRKGRPAFSEGYTIDTVVASYIHLHFASNPAFAHGFVNMCKKIEDR